MAWRCEVRRYGGMVKVRWWHGCTWGLRMSESQDPIWGSPGCPSGIPLADPGAEGCGAVPESWKFYQIRRNLWKAFHLVKTMKNRCVPTFDAHVRALMANVCAKRARVHRMCARARTYLILPYIILYYHVWSYIKKQKKHILSYSILYYHILSYIIIY